MHVLRDFAALRCGGLVTIRFIMGQVAEFVNRRRASDQIALHLVTGFALQEFQLVASFDAFGENRQA